MALANVMLDKSQTISIDLEGVKAKTVNGTVLTSKNATDYNDFDHPTVVQPKDFKDAKLKNGKLEVTLPAMSVVVLKIN